jgi:hypothetical protein
MSSAGGPHGRPGETPDQRVVPVYAFTQGRTRNAGQELPLEALATTTELAAQHGRSLQMEWRTIVQMCAQPTSVAEIGAMLRVPVGVARVLVGDLADAGYLMVHLPKPAERDGRPSQAVLGRLLDGLRAR